jgi:hypothetical protein
LQAVNGPLGNSLAATAAMAQVAATATQAKADITGRIDDQLVADAIQKTANTAVIVSAAHEDAQKKEK